MYLHPQRTTNRLLPATVATVFIRPDGGRQNIIPKLLGSLWYLLMFQDAESRLVREVRNKRLPWYSPKRIFGILMATVNLTSMPASWTLLFLGKRNASRIASLGVITNRVSVEFALLIITGVSSALLKQTGGVVLSTGSLLAQPFTMLRDVVTNTKAPQPTSDSTSETTSANASTKPKSSSASTTAPSGSN